jgi:hypothetical protein
MGNVVGGCVAGAQAGCQVVDGVVVDGGYGRVVEPLLQQVLPQCLRGVARATWMVVALLSADRAPVRSSAAKGAAADLSSSANHA